MKRKKCQYHKCENYFPQELEKCPLCGSKPTQRLTHLLIYDPIFFQGWHQGLGEQSEQDIDEYHELYDEIENDEYNEFGE